MSNISNNLNNIFRKLISIQSDNMLDRTKML